MVLLLYIRWVDTHATLFLDKDLPAGVKMGRRKVIVPWRISLILLATTDTDGHIEHVNVKHPIDFETIFEKTHWWFVVIRLAIAIAATIAAMAFIVIMRLWLWLSQPFMSILLIAADPEFAAGAGFGADAEFATAGLRER